MVPGNYILEVYFRSRLSVICNYKQHTEWWTSYGILTVYWALLLSKSPNVSVRNPLIRHKTVVRIYTCGFYPRKTVENQSKAQQTNERYRFLFRLRYTYLVQFSVKDYLVQSFWN